MLLKRDAPASHGILTINGTDLLTRYHRLTVADLTTAHTNRTNPRAIQNSHVMYLALQKSLGRDLHTTLFHQVRDLPEHEDGPGLFKTLTDFMIVASLQLSIISSRLLLKFDRRAYQFHVPQINTRLTHSSSLPVPQNILLPRSSDWATSCPSIQN